MVRIESSAVEFPECQGSPRAPTAVCERMDILKLVMENGRGDDRRPLAGRFIPPCQEFRHQSTHQLRRRRRVSAHIDLEVAIPACIALVHDSGGEDLVEHEYVPMREEFFVGMPLNIAKPREIIQNFPFCARWFGRQSMPLLDEPDLLQRQGIAFNRCGTMGVPYACVALEAGHPGNLSWGCQNSFP